MIAYADAAAFAVTVAANLIIVGFPITLGVAAALRLTDLSSPRARYAIVVVAFFAAFLLPALRTLNGAHSQEQGLPTVFGIRGDRAGLPNSGKGSATAVQPLAESVEGLRSRSFVLVNPLNDFVVLLSHSRLAVAFMWLWIAVALFLLGRELRGHVRLVLARRAWQPANARLREQLSWPGSVWLYLSEREGPFAFGLLRPAVVIPSYVFTNFHPNAVRRITQHELAHARWRDPLVNSLLRLVRAVLWPSIPLWYLERMACREREAAADRAALVFPDSDRDPNTEATEYAALLVSIGQWSRCTTNQGRLKSATAEIASSELERRVRRLLSTSSLRPTRTQLVFAGLVLSAGISGAALLPVVSRSVKPTPPAAVQRQDDSKDTSERAAPDKTAELIYKGKYPAASAPSYGKSTSRAETLPDQGSGQSRDSVERSSERKVASNSRIEEDVTPETGASAYFVEGNDIKVQMKNDFRFVYDETLIPRPTPEPRPQPRPLSK